MCSCAVRWVILSATLAVGCNGVVGAPARPASPPREASTPVAPPPTSAWQIAEAGAVYAGVIEAVTPYDSACHSGTRLTVRPALIVRGADTLSERSLLDVATKEGAGPCAKVALSALHPSAVATLGDQRVWQIGQVFLFVEAERRPGDGWMTGERLAGAGDALEVAAVAKALGPSESGFVPLAAPSLWKASAEVATDAATGLMWQRGLAPDLQQYGVADKYCRELTLAGFDDWRLPRYGELVGLADHGRVEPALDVTVFGEEPKEALLWGGEDDEEPWAMTIADGVVHSTHYDDPSPYGLYNTRCVRAHAAPALAATRRVIRFRESADTVTDVFAGRMWQRRMHSQALTQPDAHAHCAASGTAGFRDWRLPAIEELLSLTAAPAESLESPEESEGVWSSTRISDEESLMTRFLGSAAHWADAHGELHHAICVRDAPVTHDTAGHVVRRYPSGDVLATGETVAGKREGIWRYYRDGGGLWLVERYAGGRLDGDAELYFDNGALMQRQSWSDGVIGGSMTSFWWNEKQRSIEPIVEGRVHGERRSYDEEGRLAAVERFVDGRRHGPSTSYDEGRVYQEEHWMAGKRHGVATTFYDDGKPRIVTPYQGGLRHGAYRELDRNGKVLVSGQYVDDLRDGAWRGTHENGKRALEGAFRRGTGTLTTYDQAGKRSRREPYAGGKLHGISESWYASGQLRERRRWDRGAPAGLFESWHDNGQLQARGSFVKGRKDGVWTRFHENGTKYEETTYRDGTPVGLFQAWDEEGRLRTRGHHDTAGRRHGVWLEYYDGKRAAEEYYDHGVIDRPTRFHQ